MRGSSVSSSEHEVLPAYGTFCFVPTSSASLQCSLILLTKTRILGMCFSKAGFVSLISSSRLHSLRIGALNLSSVMDIQSLKPFPNRKYVGNHHLFIFLQTHCLFLLAYHNSFLSVCVMFCFDLLWRFWPHASLSGLLQLLLITNIYFTYRQGQLPVMSISRNRDCRAGALKQPQRTSSSCWLLAHFGMGMG